MVHALEEIRRTLVQDGLLIDLRPLADRWPVELTSGLSCREIGRLTDLPTGLADDEAANSAFNESSRQGLFRREIERTFPFYCYWDTPEEMNVYIQEKWADFIQLEEDIYSSARSVWAAMSADRHVRVKLKMILSRWRKQ